MWWIFISRTVYLHYLHSSLFDIKYFPDSFNFNPLNFLNRNYKQESFIPFSLGKRVCAGIILVKMELFLFFTCLFKKFKIVSENVKFNEKDYITSGFFRAIKEFKVSMMIG
jgi:cytochrome P450